METFWKYSRLVETTKKKQTNAEEREKGKKFPDNILIKSQANNQKCMGALASCREISYVGAEKSTLTNLRHSLFPQKRNL